MANTRIDFQNFHWLDVSNPTPEYLDELAKEYQLHATSVQDCLQPEHLPKFEVIDETTFVVLRAYDKSCAPDADTVQELTRKIALFYGEKFVLTIHRMDQPFLTQVLERWEKRKEKPNLIPDNVLADILNETVRTFEKPVLDSLASLESFEQEIFGTAKKRNSFRMSKGYYLKRKSSVYKRILRTTLDPLGRIMAHAEPSLMPYFQNAREMIDGLYFYADETAESTTSLISLHISLQSQKTNVASQRTNEVMRVLTIFSCFFLPINFIASIYGMNFKYMPELESDWGYIYALALMAGVSLLIFVWFRKRGWLKKGSAKIESDDP